MKGEVIGQLTAELVPSGKFDKCALELKRPDIDAFVCQMYYGEGGNRFRLVNHSGPRSNPPAEFVVMQVSGRYRMMVREKRDVRDVEEITAFCGQDFIKKGECLCEACFPQAI